MDRNSALVREIVGCLAGIIGAWFLPFLPMIVVEFLLLAVLAWVLASLVEAMLLTE